MTIEEAYVNLEAGRGLPLFEREAVIRQYAPEPDPIVGIDCHTGEPIRESDVREAL